MRATKTEEHYDFQPQFVNKHEGLQYEFFCGDRFFSVRIVETASMSFFGIWAYDGKKSHGLLEKYARLERIGDTFADLMSDAMHVKTDKNGGKITAKTNEGSLNINFSAPITKPWFIPPNDMAIHQPLLKVEVELDGQKFSGMGYCKRYWYNGDFDYWNWRFISGPVHRGKELCYLWTAEATFEFQKYDYFKLALPSGDLIESDKRDPHHRDMIAYGTLNGVACTAEVRHLGGWQWIMRQNNTDTKIVQHFSELTFVEGDKTHKGCALHEMGAGTTR